MNTRNHTICVDCNKCNARDESIFNVLKADEIESLQNVKNHLQFNYGELIFKEGQFPSGIYIILSGKVKISKSGFEGREYIGRFAKEGDILGYRALISDEQYSCSASAIAATHLCYIPKDYLLQQIRNSPELAIQFMKLLANDLRQSEERAIRMAQKPVRERVAESILILKEVYGFEEDNATININLKRDEIAGIAGTVRETATRLLSELCHDEIIVLSGRKIKIVDMHKLNENANYSF